MSHIVIAGYVTVETAVPGGRARIDIPRGAELPEDVPQEDVDRLLARGDIQPIVAPSTETETDPDAVPEGSAAVLLAWVDGDKDKAAKALATEQAKDGGARSTVVTALSKLIET